MKRVLHAVTIMNRGGEETFIMNLFREIDRSQITFDFILSSDKTGSYDEEIYELGGRIYHLPQSKKPLPHVDSILRAYRLYKFLKHHKEYQIVHFHNYHSYSALLQVIAAKAAKVKSVIVHSHNSFAPNPKISKMFRPILDSFNIYRFACSELAAKWLFGRGNRKCKIIKNGIDTTRFHFNPTDREEIRKELGIAEETVIIHIGRFNYQKNHLFLLEVFAEYVKSDTDAKLILVGDGELRDEVCNKVNHLGLKNNVILLGVREDIPALLSSSDLLLFPSLFEGLGIVLVEAQANGIPILSTDNIAHEVMFSPTLFTFSLSATPEAWAAKIKSVIKSPRTDGVKLTADAGFDMRGVADEMMKFYNSL